MGAPGVSTSSSGGPGGRGLSREERVAAYLASEGAGGTQVGVAGGMSMSDMDTRERKRLTDEEPSKAKAKKRRRI